MYHDVPKAFKEFLQVACVPQDNAKMHPVENLRDTGFVVFAYMLARSYTLILLWSI